jgi:hypothetical protein
MHCSSGHTAAGKGAACSVEEVSYGAGAGKHDVPLEEECPAGASAAGPQSGQ